MAGFQVTTEVKAAHAKELDPVFGKVLVADLHKKLNQ